jgi:hypothetical protein
MSEQNKSNRGPQNTSADYIDESSFLTELERIGSRSQNKTLEQKELNRKIAEDKRLYSKLIEEGRRDPSIKGSPLYQDQSTALRDSIRGIRSKMNSIDESHISRAESESSTLISRQYSSSSINSQVSSAQKNLSTQHKAISMYGLQHDELEARRSDIMASIRQSERRALNEVKGMFIPSKNGITFNSDKRDAITAHIDSNKSRIQEIAAINAAQHFQKISGVDPRSQMERIFAGKGKAEDILRSSDISKEMSSGGISIKGRDGKLSEKDFQSELVNQANSLKSAFESLTKAIEAGDSNLQTYNDQIKDASENIEKIEKAAAGGGGRMSGSQIANAFAGGFGAIGMAAQQIMISQRLGQVNNATGFANLANEQYDMYRKARGGDIMSQMMLGQFDDAGMFAKELKGATNIAQTAQLAGSAAQATAGGLQMTEGGAQKLNPLAYATGASTQNTQAMVTGAQNLAQGLAGTAITATDIARDVTSGQVQLDAINSQMRARQALSYVGATQMQGLRDFYTGLDVAGQSMGGRAGGMLNVAMSEGNMAAMTNARMSPEQFAQMSQLGSESMGSMFGFDQVYAARNMERGGFGSMQSNMQRMSTLASAGSNNPREGMESVLAAAMTKGLDSSKALDAMVQNTAAMVSVSSGAAVGIDTTGAVSSMLANSMNPNMANKEFALQQ